MASRTFSVARAGKVFSLEPMPRKTTWAMVPLLHFDRLVGVAVLARPKVARMLDWEDFDLLRVVGQQLASYLAEHAGQDALAEAAEVGGQHSLAVAQVFAEIGLADRGVEHQQVIDALDKTLIPSAQNAELRDLLVSVRPAFVAHLDHAKHLQSALAK